MLTAGGADQLVADGGPNGHSVFTWAVLQGLGGKADLNGDGFITATELAAYVAPAVSGVSRQTPAFGSLPGSEGGEFILEEPEQTEFINTGTEQLSGEAIKVNNQLEAVAPKSHEAPITVTDLQGASRQVEVPKAMAVGARKLGQLANDRGLQLYREQQYAAAEAQFTEALKQRPDFAQAANNLGYVFYKQAKYSEATRWFENALKIDPSRAIAYVNLGDAYAQLGQNDKARQAYQTFLALKPSAASAAYVTEQLKRL
jgi:tetratricopeptide (TPR) repeat protein